MSKERSNRSLMLTPPGTGAIGVIRVVGPDAASIVHQRFRSQHGRAIPVQGNCKLHYGFFVDENERIDDVIVSYVPERNLPTMDISAHGGVRVMERILESLSRGGAPLRDAESDVEPVWPANNRIERDAVEAMSHAKTARAVRFLGWQRVHLASHLESIASLCLSDPGQADAALDELLVTFETARTLLDGAMVAIVGPPNAGKSTLLNRLVGRATAIVSETAGTTRDWVTASVEMDGVPLTLMDTAGRSAAPDGLEYQAIEAGWKLAEGGDLALVVLDGSQPLPRNVADLWRACRAFRRRLVVVNKLDRGRVWGATELRALAFGHAEDLVEISAKTGQGVDFLAQRILDGLLSNDWDDTRPSLFIQRQVEEITAVRLELTNSPVTAGRWIGERLIGL